MYTEGPYIPVKSEVIKHKTPRTANANANAKKHATNSGLFKRELLFKRAPDSALYAR